MTLLQAVAIIIGIGFILALISSIKGRAWNAVPGSKTRFVDLAIPFALRWALYSIGVALALGVQYLLLNVKSLAAAEARGNELFQTPRRDECVSLDGGRRQLCPCNRDRTPAIAEAIGIASLERSRLRGSPFALTPTQSARRTAA